GSGYNTMISHLGLIRTFPSARPPKRLMFPLREHQSFASLLGHSAIDVSARIMALLDLIATYQDQTDVMWN
ncbi:hypothetical protein, partial [Shewanella algae]|uniref:hypothetical protein n=1 Tax=Shewanella algae TaxID=38313 RepID=UPI003006E129